MAIFSSGIILTQHKEPAFSRPLVRFVNPQTDGMSLDRPLPEQGEAVPVDDIIEAAKSARIVDERDGKLLHRKLLRAKAKAVAVIADAVDDEPYVSSKINPLLWDTRAAMGGLALCKQVAGTDQVLIMAYKMIGDLETRIPRSIDSVQVRLLRGGYPASPLAASFKGEKGEKGRKLVVGTGALIHLYRAVWRGKQQSTVFVTVAGNCVANPMNLEVSIGMTVTQILERCGLSDTPTRLVCGGSMTGIAVMDPEKTLVTYTTRAVLAFKENKRDAFYNCIGCGRCEQSCPTGLSPMYIHRFVEKAYYANLQPFDAHMCTGCGICSYVCPSKLGVAASMAKAKAYAISHFVEPEAEEGDDLDL